MHARMLLPSLVCHLERTLLLPLLLLNLQSVVLVIQMVLLELVE
jgi:hypothetical protein